MWACHRALDIKGAACLVRFGEVSGSRDLAGPAVSLGWSVQQDSCLGRDLLQQRSTAGV
jgi:hypothetical protein